MTTYAYTTFIKCLLIKELVLSKSRPPHVCKVNKYFYQLFNNERERMKERERESEQIVRYRQMCDSDER